LVTTKKDGTFKTKLPTTYRTSKKNKNKSVDGDIRKKCHICGKNGKLIVYAKPKPINEHDTALYYISRCSNCQYIHLVPATVE
jgi:hypothetical protein